MQIAEATPRPHTPMAWAVRSVSGPRPAPGRRFVGFTVVNDSNLAIDALADPDRIGSIDLRFRDDRSG
jgi:hypothetical protein